MLTEELLVEKYCFQLRLHEGNCLRCKLAFQEEKLCVRGVGDPSHLQGWEESLTRLLIVWRNFKGKFHSSADYPGPLWHIYIMCLILFFILSSFFIWFCSSLFLLGTTRKKLNILNVDPIFELAVAGRKE